MLAALRKSLVFLTPSLRRRWFNLVPLSMLAAVVEASGAAAVFGLIKIVSDPSQVASIPVVSEIYSVLPWHSHKAVILSFTLLVGLFYVAKNSLLGIVQYLQNKAVGISTATVSRVMLQAYLSAPYAFHLRRNTAEMIHNTNSAVESVFRVTLASAVSIIAEAMVVAGILLVLVITAPFVTLVAGAVLAGLLWALLRLTQRIVSRWGVEAHEMRTEALKSAQQALGGLKEARILGRERFFHDVFSQRQERLARLNYLHETLVNVPRLLIETLFICGTLLIVVLITLRGASGPEIVPLLGLYAYAGFRVIPSANRILYFLGHIRYGIASVNRLYDDYVALRGIDTEHLGHGDGKSLQFSKEIHLRDVAYVYDGTDVVVLDGISLKIARGESIGIVGATGAGKSTLIDILLGLLEPRSGDVTVDGVNIHNAIHAWRRKIGYVPQVIYLTDDTIRRNIAFGLPDEEIDEERVRDAVGMAQLDDLIGSLPQGLETIVGERGVRLSGGQRQRVAIARALYQDPEVLVFDEATSSLDNQTERNLTHAIETLQGRKTLIVIAHRLSTVRACDRLVFLRNGRIAGIGTFDDLLEGDDEFRTMAVS